MYRVYLRWPGQRVSDKTVTPSPQIAEAAFRELLSRTDLVGQRVAAVLSLDNRQLEFCRFDLAPGSNIVHRLKSPDEPIRLRHDEF